MLASCPSQMAPLSRALLRGVENVGGASLALPLAIQRLENSSVSIIGDPHLPRTPRLHVSTFARLKSITVQCAPPFSPFSTSISLIYFPIRHESHPSTPRLSVRYRA